MADTQKSANDIIVDFLNDEESVNAFGVAEAQDNDFATEGLGKDLREMSFGELAFKYGEDVARNRYKLSAGRENFNALRNQERSAAQVVGDTTIGAGAGFVNILGSLGAIAVDGAGSLIANEDESRKVKSFASDIATGASELAGGIDSYQSDISKNRKNLSDIEAEFDRAEREELRKEDIRKGSTDFMAGLKDTGRAFLDTGDRVLSDPLVTGDVIAHALGSLGPSAKIASVGAKAAGATAASVTANKAAQKLATTFGAAGGVGLSEASGAFSQAVNEVENMSHSDLERTSEDYVALRKDGYTPDEARTALAVSTGEEAFKRQLPVATAAGLLTAKFEAAPIASFRGSTLLGSLKAIGAQTLEEGIQEGAGTLNTNIAIRNQADEDRALSEGVGEGIALGAIGGAGMSTALGAPSLAAGVVSETVQGLGDLGSLAVDRAGDLDITGKANDLYEATKETLSPAVEAVKERVVPVVEAVDEAATDYLEQPNADIQEERITATQKILGAAKDEISATPEGKPIDPATEYLITEQAEEVVPAVFAGRIPPKATIVQKVEGLLETIKEDKVNIGKMAQEDAVYAATNFYELRAVAKDLPEAVRAQVAEALSAPDIKKVVQRAKGIDQNQTRPAETTEVTPEVIQETVGVAKINPTNVNPDVVEKILNHSDAQNVSPENLQFLGVAAKVARTMNERVGNLVRISQDTNAALLERAEFANGERTLPKERTNDSVSRSMQVEGFTDVTGKKLRSTTEFASDIMQAAQNPAGDFTVQDEDGVSIPVQEITTQFANLVQHMANKVDALNKSLDLFNETGRVTPVGYDSLFQGREFVKPGARGAAKPIGVTPNHPNSVKNAQDITADAVAMTEVFNTLQEAFPDMFQSGPAPMPALSLNVAPNVPASDVQDNSTEVQQPADVDVVDTADLDLIDTSDAIVEEVAEVVPETNAEQAETVTEEVEQAQDTDTAVEAEATPEASEEVAETTELTIPKGWVKIDIKGVDETYYQDPETGETASLEELLDPEGLYQTDFNAAPEEDVTEQTETEQETVTEESPATTEETAEGQSVPTDQSSDLVVEEAPEPEAVPSIMGTAREMVQATFQQNVEEMSYKDGRELLREVANNDTPNEGFIRMATAMFNPLWKGVNARLDSVKFSTKDQRSLREALMADPEAVLAIRDFKTLALVDANGESYNEQMVTIAIAAVVDWMTNARGPDPHRMDKVLEGLNLESGDLTTEEFQLINSTVPVTQAAEEIAQNVIRLWNARPNLDAPMVDARGISEGIVKELLTVAAETSFNMDKEGFQPIKMVNLPFVNKEGKRVTTAALDVSELVEFQKTLSMSDRNPVLGHVAPELQTMPSIGEQITEVDKTQSRGTVPLSRKERNTLGAIQNTAHTLSVGLSSFVDAIGFEAMISILGVKDVSNFQSLTDEQKRNNPLLRSIEGKNISVIKDMEDAQLIVDALEATGDTNTPVYYRAGISKVGRHQMKGINPQNNKILRALVTPTHSKLDMTVQENQDAFWLTVAQAADIDKVENFRKGTVLGRVQERFESRFGEAAELALGFIETGKMDPRSFQDAVSSAGMQEIAAIFAVAEYRYAVSQGTEAEFATSLSFELDGKTDGPGNMMSNFGRGDLTASDMSNFNRVGYFLGRAGMTLNQYFQPSADDTSKVNTDLYVKTSANAQKAFDASIRAANNDGDREVLYAIQRIAAAFGDFKLNSETGQIEMTRNTAKSPMTKTVYGSGVDGIGAGIADDILLNFYKTMADTPAGTPVNEIIPGYGKLAEDFQLLTGIKLTSDMEYRAMGLKKGDLTSFRELITDKVGRIISKAAKDTIGDRVTEVNEHLVAITNVQSKYITAKFDELLQELAEKRVAEGKLRANKRGVPIYREMTQRDYNSVLEKLKEFSPVYRNGDQILDISGFELSVDNNVEMSSNLSGGMRQRSTLRRPSDVGVKVIPYISIGRGDAMMMNSIYGGDNAPTNTVPIFDGIDMPIADITKYAQPINEAVLNNWNQDVLGGIVDDIDNFFAQVPMDDPAIITAMASVKPKKITDTNRTNVPDTIEELVENIKTFRNENMARKRAFRKIPVSVDHMGGSNTSFSRGEGEAVTLSQINEIIEAELQNEDTSQIIERVTAEEVTPADVTVTTAREAANMVQDSTENRLLVMTLNAIQAGIPADMRVVTGSLDQLNQYRQENFPDDGQVIKGAGSMDTKHNIIYQVGNNEETTVHELVHAATIAKVRAHYDGETNQYVERLEALMNEFLAQPDGTVKGVNAAKQAIQLHMAGTDSFSKAAALNEFMAWGLTNRDLAQQLQKTETKTLGLMVKKVLALFQRVMGGLPKDMLSSVLFNTQMLNENAPLVDDSGNNDGGDIGGNGDNGDGEVTPPARAFTNYWIDQLRDRIDAATIRTPEGAKKSRQLLEYKGKAQQSRDILELGGFSLNTEQKQTFSAIHAVLAVEMRLDTQSMLSMNKVFDFVVNNLTPEMFGPVNAQQRYSTVMSLLGSTKNDEGVSDAMAVLLALSQTSAGFRRALEQLPTPDAAPDVENTLNARLTQATYMLMGKAVGSVDMAGQEMRPLLDALSEQILERDQETEFNGLKTIMGSLTKADKFVSGNLSKLAEGAMDVANRNNTTDKAKVVRFATKSVALAASFLDSEGAKRTQGTAKNLMHMGEAIGFMVPVREFMSELVGTDSINERVMALLDRANYAISIMRQSYREDLPIFLQDAFGTHPTAEQWKSFHKGLARTDMSILFDADNPARAMKLFEEPARVAAEVDRREKAIRANYSTDNADFILDKAHQLAKFMVTGEAGIQLIKNAYAINKFTDNDFQQGMTRTIDQLVSLYAIGNLSQDDRTAITEAFASDPEAMTNMIVYTQGLNKEEDLKTSSPTAKMNAYKGFIPDQSDQNVNVVVRNDSDQETLLREGFRRVGDYTAQDAYSTTKQGYYMSDTKLDGSYSQGVLQSVRSSFKGVDATSGLSVTGNTGGLISGPALAAVNKAIADGKVTNTKDVLIPVYNDKLEVVAYEKAINPEVQDAALSRKSNMALMLGAWAGRQIEEKFAREYNATLIGETKKIYDERLLGDDNLFVNIADPQNKDPIIRDAWAVIPMETKEEIQEVFGKNNFMVRKDMVNLAVGYREASVLDAWTGKSRLPDGAQKVIKTVARMALGDTAMRKMAIAEDAIQATVSSAKDLIVVRSLVVPYMNTQANVVQLITRGVGNKAVLKGYRNKLAEIETYNDNMSKLVRLGNQIRVAGSNQNKVRILESQVQKIQDENARMSIAPMIAAGAYKNISEGITDLDVELSSGRLGDWVENQVNRLPGGLQTVVKYGLLSKDTALYKGANKAVQYGDFLAKSIYYDHLTGQLQMEADAAVSRVNEEFVNFSFLPGRSRSYLESIGASWFMTFKIRILKIAMGLMRDQPVRALMIANTVGEYGSPVSDNLVNVVAEGNLDYSTGWEMLFGSVDLNPWMQLSDAISD